MVILWIGWRFIAALVKKLADTAWNMWPLRNDLIIAHCYHWNLASPSGCLKSGYDSDVTHDEFAIGAEEDTSTTVIISLMTRHNCCGFFISKVSCWRLFSSLNFFHQRGFSVKTDLAEFLITLKNHRLLDSGGLIREVEVAGRDVTL